MTERTELQAARVDFEMSADDLNTLLAAMTRSPAIMLQCGPTPSVQERANEAWAALGKRMGFDPMTVQPNGHGDRFFSAVKVARPKPHVYRDGNQWCATWPDFINLQESPAGFADTPEQAIAELVSDTAALRQSPAWNPISELPPEGEQVVVFWIDPTGWPGEQERFDFDMIEEGCWIRHENLREEYIAVGGPYLGPGPSEKAPYTHWMALGVPGSLPPAPGAAGLTPEPEKFYSLDRDSSGIRALTADAITGALALGAQGTNPPPAGHWLTPFWDMARAMKIAAKHNQNGGAA